jgi:hypothetical protein
MAFSIQSPRMALWIAFCELESAKIFEADIYDGFKSFPDCFNEKTFESFTEKMVIFLKIKLLQNQQVKIPHSFKPSY